LQRWDCHRHDIDVVIDHLRVSQAHAHRAGELVFIVFAKLGSTNGLLLNGRWVWEGVLRRNDIIRIGDDIRTSVSLTYILTCNEPPRELVQRPLDGDAGTARFDAPDHGESGEGRYRGSCRSQRPAEGHAF
jgi:hypothetical protein